MINFNGEFLNDDTPFLNHQNRGLKYGDALFETIRVVNSKIFFWEAHYLRLMASMRMLRMEIPMSFTMEYLEAQLIETLKQNKLETTAARVRITVYRDTEGFYTPKTNNVSFIIETAALTNPFYVLEDNKYHVELYKDFYINSDMLSTLKTANKMIHVLSGVYAAENDYDNCLLLNQQKQVVEAINGNIFIVKGDQIKTPPLSDGCLNGILRKQMIQIIQKTDGYSVQEASVSPFELQKADELFITNTIKGIQPVTHYRKKEFGNTLSKLLIGRLNAMVRLS